MPRYFFSEHPAADDIAADDEGIEFPTFAAACEEAKLALRQIAPYRTGERIWMSMLDEDRHLVFRAHLTMEEDHCLP